MSKASKNMDVRLISNYWECYEGDKVINKFPSMIQSCPVKYYQLYIKSLCLHLRHSHLAVELESVQLGLGSQQEENAGEIS